MTDAMNRYERELAEYLAQAVPERWRTEPDGIELRELMTFEHELYATPWFGVWLPGAVGRPDLGREYQISFERELARAGVPDRVARVGQNLLLPTLIQFGTPAQIDQFARPTISGDILWCQGFSETEAGSDLASLRTRGERVPGGYRINGQKVWTSLAHVAQYCFALVRTEPGLGKHAGISMMLVDMTSAGLHHRPIRQIDGRQEFAEVFFDDVFVPDDKVLGQPGAGWSVAMATLGHERSSANFARQVRFSAELNRIASLVADADDGHLDGDTLIRLGAACAKARVLLLAAERLAENERAHVPTAILGAMTKLYWSEAHQDVAALGADVASGVDASNREQAFWERLYLASRAETIYAGTSEIQRNIIAQRDLVLPRTT